MPGFALRDVWSPGESLNGLHCRSLLQRDIVLKRPHTAASRTFFIEFLVLVPPRSPTGTQNKYIYYIIYIYFLELLQVKHTHTLQSIIQLSQYTLCIDVQSTVGKWVLILPSSSTSSQYFFLIAARSLKIYIYKYIFIFFKKRGFIGTAFLFKATASSLLFFSFLHRHRTKFAVALLSR